MARSGYNLLRRSSERRMSHRLLLGPENQSSLNIGKIEHALVSEAIGIFVNRILTSETFTFLNTQNQP